jgi:hypothetical protein
LFVTQKLLAKENDAPLEQRRANRADLLRAQRPREIDSADLGADMRGEWADLNRYFVG